MFVALQSLPFQHGAPAQKASWNNSQAGCVDASNNKSSLSSKLEVYYCFSGIYMVHCVFSLHFLSVWFGSPNLQQMIIMLVSRKSQCIILVCLKMVYTPPSYRWSFTTGFRDTASDKTMNDVGWYHMLDDDTNHVAWWYQSCWMMIPIMLYCSLDDVQNSNLPIFQVCWIQWKILKLLWAAGPSTPLWKCNGPRKVPWKSGSNTVFMGWFIVEMGFNRYYKS